MVIIDTNLYTKDEYIKGLSKRGRHEHTLVSKRNADLTYGKPDFDLGKLQRFMELWERQLVRGKPIQWAYPVQTIADWHDKGKLILLEAKKGDETIAMHFLKKEEGFWEAGPPMWDKEHSLQRHLGTYMWFQMVLYGIENKLGIINFGGGVDSWREMIRTRKNYTNPKYKWRFIPKSVKDNPDDQPDYKIIMSGEDKILIHGDIREDNQ